MKESKSNYKNYRVLELSNGIKAILADDVISDQSTAALCVNIGSFDDPDVVQGLAHFLEHMLFLGSEKYPGENEYDVFIKSHSGSTNASTDYERTTFQFTIPTSYFEEALERFSQFFVAPLLREDSAEREINSVDSEFRESLSKDDMRIDQLLSYAAKKDHPFSKFHWGNKLSLKDYPKKNNVDVMEHLRKFFNEGYKNCEMSLALLSQDSVDHLEQLARKYFSSIKCKPFSNYNRFEDISENPYRKEDLGKLYYAVPVNDTHMVEFIWILPPQRKYYKSKPIEYIKYLLAHESEGGILAYLKKRDYVINIEALSEHMSMFTLLQLQIQLTLLGLQNMQVVVNCVIQFIHMLQQNEPSENVQNEIATIWKQDFDYIEHANVESFAEKLSEDIFLVEDEDIITGENLITEFRPDLISSLQEELQIGKCIIIALSKMFENRCNDLEPWFRTRFCKQDIPVEWINRVKDLRYDPAFYIPKPNKFLAEDFTLKIKPESHRKFPELLEDNDHGKLWFKCNYEFSLPKVRVYFKIVSAINDKKLAYHSTCCDLLEWIQNYNMQSMLCEAETALFNYGSDSLLLCRLIEIDGFNDKLKIFLKSIFSSMKNISFTDKVFELGKDNLSRSYHDNLMKSSNVVRMLRMSVLHFIHKNPLENLAELEKLTLKEFRDFVDVYSSNLFVESLFEGNLLEKEVREYHKSIVSLIIKQPLDKKDFPLQSVLKLMIGKTVIRHYGFNKNDPSSSIQNYYQIGAFSVDLDVKARLITHIMDGELFVTLRTKEQLGYSIKANNHDTYGVNGVTITISADCRQYNADYVDERIEEFVKNFNLKLKYLSQEEYTTYIDSYVQRIRYPMQMLCDDARLDWYEISNESYMFDKKTVVAEYASKVSQENLVDFFETYFINRSTTRILSTQIIGHVGDVRDNKNIPDSKRFNAENNDVIGIDNNQSESFKLNLELKILYC